jgi:voltage-gated sodium channel
MSATSAADLEDSSLRRRAAAFVESQPVQRAIIALILLNAFTLGLETFPSVVAHIGPVLHYADQVLLSIFVIEILLKVFGHGLRFFRSGWNLFDVVVVGIALLPSSGAFSVLRALRVLRVLRLMSVMATKLYGESHPEWFGSLWDSSFSLFQIMTLEGWAEIARDVMEQHPRAWIFFLVFILLGTFTVLNLFIAVIVNAMQEPETPVHHKAVAAAEDVAALRMEIAALRRAIEGHMQSRE